MNDNIIHLEGGLPRAICNYLLDKNLVSWENRDEVTCPECKKAIDSAFNRYADWAEVQRQQIVLQHKLEYTTFRYEITDIQRMLKNLQKAEKKLQPKHYNEIYLFAEIASDVELAKRKEG